ncbi:MAG: hypothetical protein JW938_03845 [Candidatus Omnitrophica bacterium]|nr:hypothetical protein [Candidatus Omnitrophota bacterium]
MRSVLITKEEIVARVKSLFEQYKESVANIEETVKRIESSVSDIGKVVADVDDFDLNDVKPLLTSLNMQQTNLVNILKRMTELHAKMGYVIK